MITINLNNYKPESPYVATHRGVVINSICSQAFLFGGNGMGVRFIRKDQAPLCACGCEKKVKWNKEKKQWNKYLWKHNWIGKNNPNYNKDKYKKKQKRKK